MEKIKNDDLMRGMCWGLSIFFLAAAVGTAVYGGDWEQVYKGFVRIIGSPSALITDYFKVGGLSATLFNAGLCTFACCCIVRILKCRLSSSFFASYILLLAHCFYGMNFLIAPTKMSPPSFPSAPNWTLCTRMRTFCSSTNGPVCLCTKIPTEEKTR